MGYVDMTVVGYEECGKCHQPLRIVLVKDREVAFDRNTDHQHVCWDLPADANLLVLED